MPERPLILFPYPEQADRDKQLPFYSNFNKPSVSKQQERLTPVFQELTDAFENKRIQLQGTTAGLDPEYALVFEVVGSVERFYNAISKLDGMEWMFDKDLLDIAQDEDFYSESEESLNGRIYCVMSNQTAINQLLSMWRRYSNGEENVFPHGTNALKDIFCLIKTIRVWGPEDRVYETHTIEYWLESLEFDGNDYVPFEIELFYRKSESKRNIAVKQLKKIIRDMQGTVINECVISEIAYHALKVSLPRNQIQNLLNNYDEIELAKVDDIMFFRPICQSAFLNDDTTIIAEKLNTKDAVLDEDAAIAILDGMPMQNHIMLQDKIIIDDPDNFEENYLVKDRKHGTAMASLVLYGDLNSGEKCLKRKVYMRPILKAVESFDGSKEEIPNDIMVVDLIHRAVIRMFREGVAPNIKVINLSLGDISRQFLTVMSPLARLLDWLSYEYNVLFIVSAGNQFTFEDDFIEDFTSFKNLSIEERTKKVFNVLETSKRKLTVLSPAESINSITVGALYSDACSVEENPRQIYAVKKGLPSPLSTFGYGYNHIITPDLFYHGGRKFLLEAHGKKKFRWQLSVSEPGCKVAAPFEENGSGVAFTIGTSDATAMLTHEAGKCYDVLKNIVEIEAGIRKYIPEMYMSVLIKAMLVHGASWNKIASEMESYVSGTSKKMAKWIGYGVPDINRVIECTKNRVTIIGYGELEVGKAHIYKVPLPFDFSAQRVKRKLTVTLAYLTPVSSTRQKYRDTQIWFSVEGYKRLVPERQNTEWKRVRKGTLQHEIFSGENAVVWDKNDELMIKLSCREDAIKRRGTVKYGLCVSFEVAEGLDIDIYSDVSSKIKEMTRVVYPIKN